MVQGNVFGHIVPYSGEITKLEWPSLVSGPYCAIRQKDREKGKRGRKGKTSVLIYIAQTSFLA